MELIKLKSLLDTPDLPDIGPEPRPGRQSLEILRSRLDELLGKCSENQQALIRGAVLFWHDHLEASHTISQNIPGPDGSFLHGMMHRREPDYGNAAYWFRRVGSHPIFPLLGKRVVEQIQPREEILARRLVPAGLWDPFAFIDICQETGSRHGLERELLKEAQRIEFETLLEHVCREC